MKIWQIVLSIIGGLIILIALDFGFGYIGVFKTKTVGKAQQSARREVFEETQSFVEGKRQEALKFYREYKQADASEKQGIKSMVAHSFANFDEEKLSGEVKTFVKMCKYN